MNRGTGGTAGQNFYDGEGSMTWDVVMMQHPFVCNVWSHANDRFSEPASIEGFPVRFSLPFKNDFCSGHAEDHTG